jgi:hypothetical protein
MVKPEAFTDALNPNKPNFIANVITRPTLEGPVTFRTQKLADILDYEDAKAAQNIRVSKWLEDSKRGGGKTLEIEALAKREVIQSIRKEFKLPDELFNTLLEVQPEMPTVPSKE